MLTIAAPHRRCLRLPSVSFKRAHDGVSGSKGCSNKTGDRAFSRPDARKELFGGCETGFESQSLEPSKAVSEIGCIRRSSQSVNSGH